MLERAETRLRILWARLFARPYECGRCGCSYRNQTSVYRCLDGHDEDDRLAALEYAIEALERDA